MIAVMTKNVMFLSLNRIVTMVAFLFIKTATMITVFTKMSYFSVFMRMVALLTKCPMFEFLLGVQPWSQSSQNVLFLSQSSQRTVIMSRNPYISVVIIIRPPSTNIKWFLMFFRSNTNKNHCEHEQNEICKKVDHQKKFQGLRLRPWEGLMPFPNPHRRSDRAGRPVNYSTSVQDWEDSNVKDNEGG